MTAEDEMMNSLAVGDVLKVILPHMIISIPILEWLTGDDGTRLYIIGAFDENADGAPRSEPHPELWCWDSEFQSFTSTCGKYHLPEGRDVVIEPAEIQKEGTIAAAMFQKNTLIEQRGEISVSH